MAGKIFAFFGVVTALLGCGTFPQVNAITESVHDSFHIPVIVIGIIVTVLTAVVTLGGIQAISKVAQFVVPFMQSPHRWLYGDPDREPFGNSGSVCRDILMCIFLRNLHLEEQQERL